MFLKQYRSTEREWTRKKKWTKWVNIQLKCLFNVYTKLKTLRLISFTKRKIWNCTFFLLSMKRIGIFCLAWIFELVSLQRWMTSWSWLLLYSFKILFYSLTSELPFVLLYFVVYYIFFFDFVFVENKFLLENIFNILF